MSKLNLIKSLLLLFAVFLLLTGCERRTDTGEGPPENSAILDNSVIRAGDADIAALDENENGMLYQCPMDYEVISDISGRCPKCKMSLEEYPVERVRDNFHNMGHPL